MKGMEVQGVLRMNEGDGETSYAKNSQVQKKVLNFAKPIIAEAVKGCFSVTTGKRSFGIADLGCSSGPNTLLLVSGVISIVEGVSRHLHQPVPEFQVFLNDLTGNDFNTLFKSLPVLHEKLEREEGSIACSIAAVPGTFYGRLFPRRSLDFVHSSASLHWLSQVPPELDAKTGTILNAGRLHISRTSPPGLVNAYLAQFKRDFSLFLKSRSEEIVPGGRMVLTLSGRSDEDPTTGGTCDRFDLIEQALGDMISKGLIDNEKVDSFNIPFYEPSLQEVIMEIKREGSFLPHRYELCEVDWDEMDTDNNTSTETKGENMAKALRAVFEPMFKEQFGEEKISEDLYPRLVGSFKHSPREIYKSSFIVLSLIKKD